VVGGAKKKKVLQLSFHYKMSCGESGKGKLFKVCSIGILLSKVWFPKIMHPRIVEFFLK